MYALKSYWSSIQMGSGCQTKFSLVFKRNSNTRLFGDQTTFDHLKPD